MDDLAGSITFHCNGYNIHDRFVHIMFKCLVIIVVVVAIAAVAATSGGVDESRAFMGFPH